MEPTERKRAMTNAAPPISESTTGYPGALFRISAPILSVTRAEDA